VRHTFYVPVRASQAGPLALRTGRLLTGQRIGLAFTSEASLLLTLGPAQAWVRLDSRALKDLLAPLGIEHVRVDPRPIAELDGPGPQATAWASSSTWSRLDEVGTKMSSSQPASAKAPA
jgi:hypothetical protein